MHSSFIFSKRTSHQPRHAKTSKHCDFNSAFMGGKYRWRTHICCEYFALRRIRALLDLVVYDQPAACSFYYWCFTRKPNYQRQCRHEVESLRDTEAKIPLPTIPARTDTNRPMASIERICEQMKLTGRRRGLNLSDGTRVCDEQYNEVVRSENQKAPQTFICGAFMCMAER
jgi:hypothetical protein